MTTIREKFLWFSLQLNTHEVPSVILIDLSLTGFRKDLDQQQKVKMSIGANREAKPVKEY